MNFREFLWISLGLQGFQRLHGFRNRRGRILPMGDVVIDVICPEPLQALLHLMDDRILAEIPVHRLAVVIEKMIALLSVPDETAFGCQHHLVPWWAACADHLRGLGRSDGRVRALFRR